MMDTILRDLWENCEPVDRMSWFCFSGAAARGPENHQPPKKEMLSKRVRQIAPSMTLELTGKVADLRRQGIDVIAYNLGEPDFGTPENICRAAEAAIDGRGPAPL